MTPNTTADAKLHPQTSLADAIRHLRNGRYAAGFSEFEYRLVDDASGAHDSSQLAFVRGKGIPLWRGEPLAGKSVLVVPEPAAGDFFMAARFLPRLRKLQPNEILITASPTLDRYARALPLGPEVSWHHEDDLAPLRPDYYVPLLSLPHRFGLHAEAQIPPPLAAVLPAAADEAWTRWRRLLAAGSDVLLVGIAWMDGADHPGDISRSIPHADFMAHVIEPLREMDGVRLVSLQKDAFDAERRSLGLAGVDLSGIERCDDWYDTVGLVRRLDCLIAIDTDVVHLAATYGVETVMLNRLPALSDWRWLDGRSDSPWYPSLSIVAQRQAGDWGDVMDDGVRLLIEIIDCTRGSERR